MNVTIKSKFSMIIILMILISVVFSYAITSEIVYRNIESRFSKAIVQSKKMLFYYMEELKLNMKRNSVMLSKDLELRTFLEGGYIEKDIKTDEKIGKYYLYHDIKDRRYNYFKLISDFEMKMETYTLDRKQKIKVNIMYKDGDYIYQNDLDSYLDESSDILFQIQEKWNKGKNNISNFAFDSNGQLFLKSYAPVYNLGGDEVIGGIAVNYEMNFEFFNGLKKMLDADVIVLNKDMEVKLWTIEGEKKPEKIILNKNNKNIEIGKNIYEQDYIEIKNLEDRVVGYICVINNKNEIMKNIKEISVYLFVALFFVFSLIFIVSIELIETLTESIKELTFKINRLRSGDFQIDFGKLKKSNDEIGVLAQDFEEMVDILKRKMDELKVTSQIKEENAQKLEIINKELEEARIETEEKSKNIDMINKMLNNRIREITNIYYLIINVSKHITEEKFYNTLVRGLRDGLRVKKIVMYEKLETEFILKSKVGINIDSRFEKIKLFDLEKICEQEIVSLTEIKGSEWRELEKSFKVPYVIPLFSTQENNHKEIYGFLIFDEEKEFDEEEKKTITTYIKTVILAFDNRRLYTKMIGEIEKLEETTSKLRESERLKNIFLANVSHEIKIPIVPIKVYTEMMLGGKIGDINPKQRKGLMIGLNNIERLEEIIENILNYSRMESGKFQIIMKKFNLKEVIEESSGYLMNKAEAKSIRLSKEFIGNNFDAFGDADAINQVLINLISNAVKFSNEFGNVFVRVIEEEKKFLISIEDEGVGIDKEQVNIIFESFKQLEEGDTRRYGGVGLGLTIVKHIIEKHGETINIESIPGKGTKLSFFIEKAV